MAAASPGQLAGYRVVFFYCESSSNPAATKVQEATARALQAELGRDENLGRMKFEVKELPEVLNASPGYSIHTNQIRYNPEDKEEASSLALKALLEKTGVATAGKLDFSRVTVGKRTPSYLSVLLCGRRVAA